MKGKKRGTYSQNLQWLHDHLNFDGPECLVWPFGKRWNGYGQVWINEKIGYPHRVMCELVNGPPPTPKHVAAHSCHKGHEGCVHPKHVSWKTPRENLLERQNIPKMDWPTKRTNLTPNQITAIIALKGKMNQREIGELFGISYQHVSVVQNRKLLSQ